MVKRSNYDDMAGFKTPTQLRTEGQLAQLSSDMRRIDAVIATGDFDQLKALHVELDGTYQDRIKSWGSSMYNYIKGMGFTYDFISDEALRDNLQTMKGKLRGLLFEIAPNAAGTEITGEKRTVGDYQMSQKQRRLLADFAKIKQCAAGNMAITIQNEDYPRYKDTLEYMVEYEFITPVDIDFGDNHMYFKQLAFDSFTEHVLTLEPERDEPMSQTYNNKKVFVVHGHDHRLLDEIELMLRRIDLEPVIVKNEANSGRTVIEKIEDLTDVGFGIVLYTGCDEGRKKGDDTLRDRARQNVIFEHGYLCAKLGRGRVAALNDTGIEVPSDLAGVLYIHRSASDWKTQLMREMRAAGLEFDSTKA